MKNRIRWLLLLALLLGPALLRAADVTVAVDPALDRHPVSPLIYGVSFGNDTDVASRRWTVRRWGGNSTTRYNWMTDVTNIASDWYFENYPQATVNPATLPNGSSADYFIDATRSASSNVLLTVPIIGWAPKELTHPSGPINWGFSVARYGAQCSTDFWVPDAGNGYNPTCATPIVGNDPADTSTAVDQSWATAWIAHISARVGTAAQGGVRFYALDNEPMLWNSTHRDVHPDPPSYDEMWGKTVVYAAAIKAQDPSSKILGPDEWGWCAYFWSALDGCGEGGPDRSATAACTGSTTT
jgi:Glycoside hydrolase family 44